LRSAQRQPVAVLMLFALVLLSGFFAWRQVHAARHGATALALAQARLELDADPARALESLLQIASAEESAELRSVLCDALDRNVPRMATTGERGLLLI